LVAGPCTVVVESITHSPFVVEINSDATQVDTYACIQPPGSSVVLYFLIAEYIFILVF